MARKQFDGIPTAANVQPLADPSRLTDDEADLIIQRVGWMLRDALSPMEFAHSFGRGILYEPAPADRETAREMVRMFARGESGA